jgi:hypothetical protein
MNENTAVKDKMITKLNKNFLKHSKIPWQKIPSCSSVLPMPKI